MSRPIYTVLYSLMIIGIFFGLSSIYQSCGNNGKNMPSTEEVADKVEEVADSYTEESFFEDDDGDETDPDGDGDSDSEISTVEPEVEEPQLTTTFSPSPSTSSGTYMVIAGNYLLENNAGAMVRNLKSAGYNQAEKVVFDLSQYYTVVAGSYDSRSVANSISSELTGKGIDNYVLKRK